MTYDKALYAIVTLTADGADIKGTDAEFILPTSKDLNMSDSLEVFPLVSFIKSVNVTF